MRNKGSQPKTTPDRASPVTPETVRSELYRLTPGEDVITPATWAGSVPQVGGIAPRLRVGRSRWFNLLWLLPIGFVLLIAAVAVAQGLRNVPSVQRFIASHPGTTKPLSGAPTGFPSWLRWQHFFNVLFMIFIIRSGVQILSDHPRLYWTRHCTPGRDWFRIQKPVPDDPLWTAKQDSITLPGQVGLPGLRHSIGLARWWHLGVDTLWLANGVVLYVQCARREAVGVAWTPWWAGSAGVVVGGEAAGEGGGLPGRGAMICGRGWHFAPPCWPPWLSDGLVVCGWRRRRDSGRVRDGAFCSP